LILVDLATPTVMLECWPLVLDAIDDHSRICLEVHRGYEISPAALLEDVGLDSDVPRDRIGFRVTADDIETEIVPATPLAFYREDDIEAAAVDSAYDQLREEWEESRP
ncbi:MAG: hypothetical protein VW405_13205, partial [Rhodospirillaceae bacterium]